MTPGLRTQISPTVLGGIRSAGPPTVVGGAVCLEVSVGGLIEALSGFATQPSSLGGTWAAACWGVSVGGLFEAGDGCASQLSSGGATILTSTPGQGRPTETKR